MRKFVIALQLAFSLILISGCGLLSREKPAVQVSELRPVSNALSTTVRWNRNVGSNKKGGSTVLSISLDGSVLYVAAQDGSVSALKTNNGAAIWDTNLDAELMGGAGTGNGSVFVTSAEGEVIALNASTGSHRWTTKVSTEVPSAPVAQGGVVVIHTNDGHVYGLNASNGEELWVFQRSPSVLSIRGTGLPVFDQDQVIIGMDAGRLVSLNPQTGNPNWDRIVSFPIGRTELDRVVDIDGRIAFDQDSVFITSYQGAIASVNKSTGKTNWTTAFSSHQGVVTDGVHLYASDASGHVAAFDLQSGGEHWKQTELSGRRLSPVVLANNYLAVSDLDGYIHWLRLTDGQIVARTRAVNSNVRAPILSQGDSIYVYGDSGEVAAVSAP